MTEPHHRSRRVLPFVLAGVVALAAIVLLVVQRSDDDDGGPEGASTSTTTSDRSTSSSSSSTSASTPTTTVTPDPIDADTPLSERGIGAIEAGMTVAEAEAASGLRLAPDGSFEAFGGHCYYVVLEGQPNVSVRVRSPNDEPVVDPGDGVISVISVFGPDPGSPSTRVTTGGIGLGATEAEVRAAYGDAVEEQPHDYVPDGAYLYVHPDDSPGFGFRYVLDEQRVVTSIDAGEASGITAAEGCA